MDGLPTHERNGESDDAGIAGKARDALLFTRGKHSRLGVSRPVSPIDRRVTARDGSVECHSVLVPSARVAIPYHDARANSVIRYRQRASSGGITQLRAISAFDTQCPARVMMVTISSVVSLGAIRRPS